MFCASVLIFDCNEGVQFRFHVLRSRTCFYGVECVWSRFLVLCARIHFRRSQGYQVPFSCFALPESFPAVTRASGPVFMVCASGLVFCGVECVWSRFHGLRSRTRFLRYRGRRVPFQVLSARTLFQRNRRRRQSFSCFELPESFSTVPRLSAPIFKYCAPGLFFGGNECVQSRFHVLRSRTCFLW
jgi:hypothetical protein